MIVPVLFLAYDYSQPVNVLQGRRQHAEKTLSRIYPEDIADIPSCQNMSLNVHN
jgi:uncharacterized protein YdaL